MTTDLEKPEKLGTDTVLGKQGKLDDLAVSLHNEVEILDQPVLNRLEKICI